MPNITINSSKEVFSQIKTLLINARNHVVQSVNTTMVYTYFEIGRIIVENEQGGKERAEYNKQTLKKLSKQLTAEFGKGFSLRNLEYMRRFYIIYQKTQTVSALLPKMQLSSAKSRKSSAMSRISRKGQTPSAISHKFTLSWSHYVLF